MPIIRLKFREAEQLAKILLEMAEPNVNLTPLGIRLGALSPPCASLKMENGEDNGREVVTLHLSVSSRYELVSHSLSIQPSFASKPVHSLHPCF